VPIVPLHRLLGLACATDEMQRPQTGQLLLLVVRVRSEKLALQVDELLDERDMVIKPLPPHMQHQQLVSGMVVTGKNELVSILHAPALLEMARALREDRGDAERRQQAPSGGYHILVVDDSTNTREIEKEVLEAHGYRVTLAEDGRRGLEEAMAHQFDAVLTDVEMPNMDGFTLTHQLRSRDSYQHTPIVIITSREQEQDKRRGIEVGADAYIVKGDFDQSSLVDTLAALLG
jgi:two-component system chemotaxis sensor kinase CheA